MIDTKQMRPGFVPNEGTSGDQYARRSLHFGEPGSPSLALQEITPKASVQTAFLIDSGYRLEIDLTPCEINKNALSNRRWIRISCSGDFPVFQSIFSAISSQVASETGAADVLYSVRGNR
jgi:hypothetical protein